MWIKTCDHFKFKVQIATTNSLENKSFLPSSRESSSKSTYFNTCVLTYICRSFGDGQVGAHAPGSSVVVLLAAAAVWPRGVVLALAAQLPLVEHAAVGVQVALAPETEKTATDDGDMNRHHSGSAESIPSGVNSSFFFLHPRCVCFRFWNVFSFIYSFILHGLIEIQAGYLTGSRVSTKLHYARL